MSETKVVSLSDKRSVKIVTTPEDAEKAQKDAQEVLKRRVDKLNKLKEKHQKGQTLTRFEVEQKHDIEAELFMIGNQQLLEQVQRLNLTVAAMQNSMSELGRVKQLLEASQIKIRAMRKVICDSHEDSADRLTDAEEQIADDTYGLILKDRSVIREKIAQFPTIPEDEREAFIESVCEAPENRDISFITFSATLDGQPLPNILQDEVTPYAIGSQKLLFEDFIKTLHVALNPEGDTMVKFPDDYHLENLKGKEVKFTVRLHKLKAHKMRLEGVYLQKKTEAQAASAETTQENANDQPRET